MCFKLVKSGQVVHSQRIKSHFLNMAKEVQLFTKDTLHDPKKLEMIKAKIDALVKTDDHHVEDI